MLLTWPTSPITEALARVLEVILGPGKVARKRPEGDKEYLIVSYRDSRDFNFLWTFWKDEALQGAGDRKDQRSSVDAAEPNSLPEKGRQDLPNGDIIEWIGLKNTGSIGNKSLVIVWDGI